MKLRKLVNLRYADRTFGLTLCSPQTGGARAYCTGCKRQCRQSRRKGATLRSLFARDSVTQTALHFAMPEDGKEETVQFKLAKLLLEEGCDSRIADRVRQLLALSRQG